FLVGHHSGRVAKILVGAGLDRLATDAKELAQPLQVVKAHDHTDATGHRGGVSDDIIGSHGQVKATAGSHIHQAGHDRFARVLTEPAQVLVHDVAGCDSTPRAVDPQHDGLDAVILRCRI